jgi:N-ethylmaleimide reductase
MGRQSHSSLHAVPEIVAPSAIPKIGHIRDANYQHQPYETPRALTTEEVHQTVNDYIHSAKLAKQAGFDGVEIHAANGNLHAYIDEYIHPSIHTYNITHYHSHHIHHTSPYTYL